MSAENRNGRENLAKTALVVGGVFVVSFAVWAALHPAKPTVNTLTGLTPGATPTTEVTPNSGETFIQSNPVKSVATAGGTVYSADGTPFNIIPDPQNLGRTCAQISGAFQDVDGHRWNAGRLAQSLGQGSVTFYRGWGLPSPLTIDTTADPFPSQVKIVHVGDFGCK